MALAGACRRVSPPRVGCAVEPIISGIVNIPIGIDVNITCEKCKPAHGGVVRPRNYHLYVSIRRISAEGCLMVQLFKRLWVTSYGGSSSIAIDF